MSVKEIAAKAGRSETHVRNRLELSGATPEVKKAVDKKEITVRDAQAIVRDSDGKVAAQAKALEKKKGAPKQVRARPLKLSIKDGSVRYSGPKNQECKPIFDLLSDRTFKDMVTAAGFDPDTIQVSVVKTGGGG